MENIRKFITMMGVLLTVLGTAALAGSILFMIQLVYHPSNVPIVNFFLSSMHQGESFISFTADNAVYGIRMSESARDLFVVLMGLTVVSTTIVLAQKAISTGAAFLATTKNHQWQPGGPINTERAQPDNQHNTAPPPQDPSRHDRHSGPPQAAGRPTMLSQIQAIIDNISGKPKKTRNLGD